MACISVFYWCTIIYLQMLIIGCLSNHHGDSIDTKVLNVGQELEKESLPIQIGQRLYQLHGLKASSWYEVKISYPASIPASFSIKLKRNDSKLWLDKNRRLLNTEKLIFEANISELSDHNEMYVLVTVEAAGIVAKSDVQERENVLFNIVCDELSYGIPYKAWCVGVVAALCLVFAFLVPYFFPSYLLMTNPGSPSTNLAATKTS